MQVQDRNPDDGDPSKEINKEVCCSLKADCKCARSECSTYTRAQRVQ